MFDEFDKRFDKQIEFVLRKPPQAEKKRENWIVKYNGQQVQFSSGKQAWSSIGSAKNAIVNEFYNMICIAKTKQEREQLRQHLYSKFEFVRLS